MSLSLNSMISLPMCFRNTFSNLNKNLCKITSFIKVLFVTKTKHLMNLIIFFVVCSVGFAFAVNTAATTCQVGKHTIYCSKSGVNLFSKCDGGCGIEQYDAGVGPGHYCESL